MTRKFFFLICFLFSSLVSGQDKYKDREAELFKENSIKDRAGNAHNVSNIGLFFENRGKLYPRRITQGPSGEFPINSGKHYIYRINQFIGIPGNVVQARYTDDEEWEAMGGFHNPELAKIAMSDNPQTWNKTNGWPVKDKDGNPVFKSDQDSYCVFNDSNNSKPILGIQVAQTGYAYGVESAKNLLFFKYDITNNSNKDYTDLYFGLYTDIDIGNVSGGVPEYGDDKIQFDKERNFVYFYDDGISTEWPDNKTGMMGVALLRTPKINGVERGLTDMHYNLYDDDENQDTIQYGIMSSSLSLKNSKIGSRYFHTGNNPDIHFDDVASIPESGLDIVANLGSGPYSLAKGETITIITAIVAGENEDELYSALGVAEKIVQFDFDFSKPPQNSNLSAVARDGKVFLYWDDKAESSFDKFSNEYDFEGYRLYRSNDNGINWTLLADFDVKNFIGNDIGLKYSYVDSTVTNGFEYWYSVTAFDKGNTLIESLESPKGNTVDAVNLVSVTPYSASGGYNPVTSQAVEHIKGNSNYHLSTSPVDDDQLSGNQYEVSFDYIWRREVGDFNTEAEIIVRDTAKTDDTDFRITFLSPGSLEIVNMKTGDFIEPTPKSYMSDTRYNLSAGLAVLLTEKYPDDFLAYPSAGNQLKIKYAVNVVRNGIDTVVNKRPFSYDQTQTTSDGVQFKFEKPEAFVLSRLGGTDNIELEIGIEDELLIADETYIVRTGKGFLIDGIYQVPLKISDSKDVVIITDTLANNEQIVFGGFFMSVLFNDSDPPVQDNMFSILSTKPLAPNLGDKYSFGIKGSFINRKKLISDARNIKVVPNPYMVASLYEPEFGELRKEPLRQIQFINLPAKCKIHIFTIDADLIKTLDHDAISGTEVWDLRAEGGREVAAGIYMYVVKSDDIEFKGRFAIIK